MSAKLDVLLFVLTRDMCRPMVQTLLFAYLRSQVSLHNEDILVDGYLEIAESETLITFQNVRRDIRVFYPLLCEFVHVSALTIE